MFLNFRRISLAAATAATLAVGALASSTGAMAWGPGPWGGPHHWGGGYRHGWYGPRPGPVFFAGGPAVVYGGYGGADCFLRSKWVPGPFGWHKVVRRVCY